MLKEIAIDALAFTIRDGTAADAPEAARVNIGGWHTTFQGILPTDFLDSLSVDSRSNSLAARFADPDYSMFVAETLHSSFLGFADCGPSRDSEWLGLPELYAIYVRPELQGRGVGRALFSATARAVLAAGHDGLILSVLSVNPSEEFYRKIGGSEAGRSSISLGGEDQEVIYFRWSKPVLQELAAS